jgi:PAS domain S-box-containing protein
MIGAMTDISARTRAEAALSVSEQALHQSEAKYRTLYRETPAMMHSIDTEGRLVSVSQTWLRSLGYSEAEVIGRPSTDFLTPASQRFAREVILPAFFKTGVCVDVPYQLIKKDGSVLDVLLSATAEWEGGHVTRSLAVMVDVTAKKLADEALLASLRDKEVLLRELHHRVKNNLQIISSLLSLQSQRVSDPVARELFRESQKRVRAMALVHENLYRTHDFAMVDVVQFLRALTSNVLRLYGAEANRIELELAIENVELEVESAIPCALVINELLTNCLKHAFTGRTSGTIRVMLTGAQDSSVTLVVADDGVGMPAHVDAERAETLGLDIVHTLVGQLHGTTHIARERGTRFEIRFPRVKRKPA